MEIAKEIKRLYEEEGIPYRDMTVLYRAHYVTRTVEEAFLKADLPYTIYSGVQFFDRKEVKDALSYLRLLALRDDLSFRRIANVPKRNLGERRMRFLEEYAEKHQMTLYQGLKDCLEEPLFKGTKAKELIDMVESLGAICHQQSISEILATVLDKSGYERMLRTEGSQERLDNLAELRQAIYQYETTCGEETTMETYLARVALFSNRDADIEQDKIKLMTIHAAKGLEFPVVFLVGMNEGILPSRKTKTLDLMEEERRLAFVAVTRAMDRLYLSCAGGLNFHGDVRYPSRFLLDIDPELLRYLHKPQPHLLQDAKKYVSQKDIKINDTSKQSLYPVGTRIHHMLMGDGIIQEVDEEHRAYVIKFDDIETPRRIAARVKMTKR